MGSYTRLAYHVVFSTRYRRPLIREDVRDELYRYFGGVVRAKDGSLIQVGGVDDHVHLLVSLTAKYALSDIVRDMKANSSRWMTEKLGPARHFEWQTGYAAFTVSASHVDVVERYIKRQETHHRQVTFQQEYERLLERHGVKYEPEYLFEGEHAG